MADMKMIRQPIKADAADPKVLPLSEAVVRWSDQSLVEAVRAEERPRLATHIQTFYGRSDKFSIQLTPDQELRRPTNDSWMMGLPNFSGLIAAWRALERDFKSRLVGGTLHLRGVQTAPERGTERIPIGAIRAADFEFGLRDERLRDAEFTYVAVELSRSPFQRLAAQEVRAPVDPLLLTDKQIGDLSPDVVASLLERHAEHVRSGLQKTLLPPGKASAIALIASKMTERARRGQSAPKLNAEARWLAAWAASVAPSWGPPGEKGIMNKLGELWRQLHEAPLPSVEASAPPGSV